MIVLIRFILVDRFTARGPDQARHGVSRLYNLVKVHGNACPLRITNAEGASSRDSGARIKPMSRDIRQIEIYCTVALA